MSGSLRNDTDTLEVPESRDFRAYHAFLRSCRNFMDGSLVRQMGASYDAVVANGEAPQTIDDANPILDDLLEFQLYSWCFRHFQRFKYHRPDFGIFDVIERDRDRIIADLDSVASSAGDDLRLNATLEIPEYYRFVDFHQHTGGVHSDPLDGVAYEFGRRTTNPAHMDPNLIYRLSYSQFPDRAFDKVLDWGTGHGAGLVEWQKLHPESECYGVDLSAPCLKLAHKRAREHGFKFKLSQQDVEHLDFEDDTFDCIFHLFMFHEIPPINLKNALKEVLRVLKPGGIFIGPEFGQGDGGPMQQAVQVSHTWNNNETYTASWIQFDIEKAARDVGFRRVSIEPFKPYEPGKAEQGSRVTSWRFYQLEK
ncbi:MAG: class I SAM-dependent methyltransferase [Rhodospirillaceae bacterium]|nr:class I SAM-dependent methyltransferase [Rhodospirillaceae bacterium]